jgi:hypothetical protein
MLCFARSVLLLLLSALPFPATLFLVSFLSSASPKFARGCADTSGVHSAEAGRISKVRQAAERAVADAAVTELPSNASFEEAQQMLKRRKTRLSEAVEALHIATDNELRVLEKLKVTSEEIQLAQQQNVQAPTVVEIDQAMQDVDADSRLPSKVGQTCDHPETQQTGIVSHSPLGSTVDEPHAEGLCDINRAHRPQRQPSILKRRRSRICIPKQKVVTDSTLETLETVVATAQEQEQEEATVDGEQGEIADQSSAATKRRARQITSFDKTDPVITVTHDNADLTTETRSVRKKKRVDFEPDQQQHRNVDQEAQQQSFHQLEVAQGPVPKRARQVGCEAETADADVDIVEGFVITSTIVTPIEIEKSAEHSRSIEKADKTAIVRKTAADKRLQGQEEAAHVQPHQPEVVTDSVPLAYSNMISHTVLDRRLVVLSHTH